MTPYRELLIGCGRDKRKRYALDGTNGNWTNVVTLDYDERCDPDILHDLRLLPYPFQDEWFDEIHAYEVLEHVGKQGDYKFFFAQFTEFHRILKPGGHMLITVPRWDSVWAWGDPGHTRVLNEGTFAFLDQANYGKQDTMTDYRDYYKVSFGAQLVTKNEHSMVVLLWKK